MPPPRPLTTHLISPLRRPPQHAPHLKPRRAYHPSPTSALKPTSRTTYPLLRTHPSPRPHCQRRPHQKPYSTSPEPKHYTFEEVRDLSSNPSPKRIIIDVREPSELQQTGRIPGAYSMPLTSNPDAFYLSKEDFFDRFGFEKPSPSPTPSSFSETDSNPDTASRISSSPSPSPTSKSATSSSPFTQTLKDREAHAGLSSDGDASGVDSAAINKEAMGGGGNGEAEGEGVEEVIFYCKAGVRSRAAARMAREWEGVRVGEMRGGWVEWEGRGGEVERGR
ncbi:hypothetical protein JMJ35_010060 [Cladonia borealis]|uniref:Rhodanese domain-containing protein n=1 Tax=Cladonia borealis TaxID=184061 RepID=A0AA39UXN2_9LECA|nr:hypothetical protein JMJ35_010060 [Cladonia borealis]